MNKEDQINKNEAKAEASTALFSGGFNCCQSVLAAYAPDLGLDSETALKIASSFGGGMAAMGLTCGAVTGALMVLGLVYGRIRADDDEAKERNYELVMRFVKEFKESHGAIGCSELLGYDISTAEGKAAVKEMNLTKTLCPEFVRTAARILEGLVNTGKQRIEA